MFDRSKSTHAALPAAALIAALLISCASLRPSVVDADVDHLLESRDYFTLREQLADMPDSPERSVAEVAVLNAFNEPEASNAAIDELLAESALPDHHRLKVLRIRRDNFLRMYRYAEAYDAARDVLDLPTTSRERRRDDENVTSLLRPLRDVPPQTADIRSDSRIAPDSMGRIPLRINGHERAFAVDTGANLSVLMRSEAHDLGLDIRTARVEVGTSTDVNMLADVAVADSLAIGSAVLRNVVFLVFADRALSFSEAFEIRGLIGFPIIEALREVHFLNDGSLYIPQEPEAEQVGNLALDGLDPLIQAGWRQSDLICRIDTGANMTDFYEPFYREHRLIVERIGRSQRTRTAGVGGVREFDVVLLPRVRLRIAGRSIRLENIDVYTDPIVAEESNYLDCNVGRDVLEQFGGYAFNFESMSLVLP